MVQAIAGHAGETGTMRGKQGGNGPAGKHAEPMGGMTSNDVGK